MEFQHKLTKVAQSKVLLHPAAIADTLEVTWSFDTWQKLLKTCWEVSQGNKQRQQYFRVTIDHRAFPPSVVWRLKARITDQVNKHLYQTKMWGRQRAKAMTMLWCSKQGWQATIDKLACLIIRSLFGFVSDSDLSSSTKMKTNTERVMLSKQQSLSKFVANGNPASISHFINYD